MAKDLRCQLRCSSGLSPQWRPVQYRHRSSTWAFAELAVEPKLGTILACADDIGAAMRSLESLEIVYKLFE